MQNSSILELAVREKLFTEQVTWNGSLTTARTSDGRNPTSSAQHNHKQ